MPLGASVTRDAGRSPNVRIQIDVAHSSIGLRFGRNMSTAHCDGPEPPDLPLSRRGFVFSLTGAFMTIVGPSRWAHEHRCGHGRSVGPHPDPRPDVDASSVLTAEDLAGYEHVLDIYDGIREIPHIADGIRCHCGCPDLPGFRSLLTCFEDNGMAMSCQLCQTEGRIVIRLHGSGRTLDQIREAVDARFG